MSTPSIAPPLWRVMTRLRICEPGPIGDAAAWMAEAGVPVFPCAPGGKQPLTSHGFQDATTDLDRVRAWWRRTPQANIGVPTGTASGMVVVDVDVHPSGTGFPAFTRAQSAGLVTGWAWLVRTPSGGIHAYFPAGGAEQRCWQVPRRHVDFRGDGGYIVVPPSRVTGEHGDLRAYRVIAVAQDRPRPLDATALRGLLDPPRPERVPMDLPVVGSRPEKLAAWVATRPEGARNQGLFWAACRLAERGHCVRSSLGILGDAALTTGLTEREIETTIRSAHRTAACLSTGTGPSPPAQPTAIGL